MLLVPIPEKEKTEIFIFTILYGASKGFMKALIFILISLPEMHGAGRINSRVIRAKRLPNKVHIIVKHFNWN